MANLGGRRAPNVSQYIANLNTIPSDYDLATQEDYSIADDLAIFTNAEFYDWDNVEKPKIEYDVSHDEPVRRENATAARNNGKELDFSTGMLPDTIASEVLLWRGLNGSACLEK